MLVGRDELLAEVLRQLDRCGRVLVTGPPGIGRTSLLDAACRELLAAGRTVWRISPGPGDRTTPHAGLSELLSAVPADQIAALPAPQAASINSVLCRDRERPDPIALRLATLALLRGAAEPVALVLDDLHRLDEASAEVLAYAARGLGAGLVLSRPGTQAAPHGLDRDATEIVVPSLDSGHMVQLLDAHGLTCRAAGQVHAASGGIPRLALAIGAAAHGSSAGSSRVPRSVALLCRELLAQVPAPAGRFLLAAALSAGTSIHVLRRAGLFPGDEVLALAELAGLVLVDAEERVTVRAGALAATVIGDAAEDEVMACHRALADAAFDEPTRLWHASMTVREDGAAAQALAAARLASRAQGNPRRAAEVALRAAELAPADFDRSTIVGWLSDAAADAGIAGDAQLVRRALAGLERHQAPPAERARARLAVFDVAGQDIDDCDELLSTVLVEATGHPGLLSAAHLRLAIRANIAEGSPRRATSHARRAVQYAVIAADRQAEVKALTYLARMQRVIGDVSAEETLATALAVQLPQSEMRVFISPWFVSAKHSLFDDRLHDARHELLALLPVADATGMPDDQIEVLRCLAEVEARLGRCAAALAHARRAVAISERTGLSPGPAWYSAAIAELAGGTLGRARALAEGAVRASTEERDQIYLARGLHIRGLIQLASGDAAGAVRSLRTVRELEQAQDARDPSLLRWHGDFAEALIAVGAVEEATAFLAEVRPVAAELCRMGVLAALDRAEGLRLSVTGLSTEAIDLLWRVGESFARLGMPLEQARTLLALASAQRRRRRWAAAREATLLADSIYREHGASPWEPTAVESPASAGLGLTQADRRLVELVASGATNREIAHAMFLSVKTVESSLTRIYRQVGVRSRVQLSTLVSSGNDKGSP
ncbi:DNA-binding CsgD family transcriptional regulator [Allocatelliglobosispora scoriae]|uniref:DNA-binding CsgD family transcriptional regulator n=1 Tax=Allocatelliglobosispora scoriae TaxID=643052 RepID=A0A841BUH0_9ACTN|nr:LuxR family transcriptional regulator [Allocatelliglobosispora scoriae]MBB5871854.1 DNA-binding CsgD family transcriptional regulator [Allocatelliglobosispora scoriae]